MKLSAAIIVKNEEAILKTCLDSIEGIDEIVVVDTGSTDNTIVVASTCGAVVHQFEWRDDFAAARNFAIEKTTGDWVLIIDADETMQEGGIDIIREHLEKDVQGFYVGVTGLTNYKSIRVMKRDVRYKGAVHETPSCTVTDHIPVLITAAYSDSHKADPDRNYRILGNSILRSRYPRHLYYLAKELANRKKWRETLEALDKYLALAFWLPETGDAFLMKAKCHWYLKEGEQARLACLRALNCNANHRAAAEFMAEITFPENARVWRAMADIANNSKVLFEPGLESIYGKYAKERYIQDQDVCDKDLITHARTSARQGNACSVEAMQKYGEKFCSHQMDDDYTHFRFAFTPQGVALDVGCDHGALTYILAESPKLEGVVGLDLYPESIYRAERLRKYADPKARMKVSFICADFLGEGIEEAPVGRYDLLTCFHTLEHFFEDDLPIVLHRMIHLTGSGGRIVIVVPDGRSFDSPNHRTHWDETKLAEFFGSRRECVVEDISKTSLKTFTEGTAQSLMACVFIAK